MDAATISFGPLGGLLGCYALAPYSNAALRVKETEQIAWSRWSLGFQPEFSAMVLEGDRSLLDKLPPLSPGWGCELLFRSSAHLHNPRRPAWLAWNLEESGGLVGALAAPPIKGIRVSVHGLNWESDMNGAVRIRAAFQPEYVSIQSRYWVVQDVARVYPDASQCEQYVVWLDPLLMVNDSWQ